MTVRTRFAPSPTGYLHIGGARTALFNYLYAKHMGGKFLLRIEDTDKARNTPAAVTAIYQGMAWLGLNWDEDVVLQSKRADRHREVAYEMLAKGHAYYSDADITEDGAPQPLRIRGIKGSQVIDDLVQGTVTWPQDIDDFVILRGDGTPTYMLAVVVDDHDMGITHVIRGDDHLNNAFRQNSIYKAMGWDLPTYGHIPLIHGEDGKKLSKRTGAAAVEDYRDELGILPEAMINYLAKLGWGHGDDEIFDIEQAIAWFDIKDVNRNPARLDKKKLANINGQYIRKAPISRLVSLVDHRLGAGRPTASLDTVEGKLYQKQLTGIVTALQERSADLNAMTEGTMFLWCGDSVVRDAELTDAEKHVLQITADEYLAHAKWTHDGIMEALNNAAEFFNIKLGKVVAPLRMALTGSKVSPPIFDVCNLLGRAVCNHRIKEALDGV